MTIDMGNGVRLAVGDGARWTRESRDDGIDIVRIFDGAVVLAASTEPLEGRQLGDVTGSVVSAYSDRPGFRRSTLQGIDLDGAVETHDFTMQWVSESGIEMESHVRVCQHRLHATVLHAAYPQALASTSAATAEAMLGALEIGRVDGGGA